MPRLLFTTVPGLEAVAADELRREHALESVVDGPGRLSAPAADADLGARVRRLNACLRCVDRVGVLLAGGGARPLEEVGEVARGVDYGRWIAADQSFAVRASRRGRHEYGSPDVGRVVGQSVIDVYRDATGRRLVVDLDDPDVILRADVRDDEFRLWLDTTGDADLSRRAYRDYAHMASMRPVVANLLLRLSGWHGEELIDPLCGSATIPIEAALRARGVAPAEVRGAGWAWERLALPGATEPPPAPSSLVPSDRDLEILGIERFDRHLQGAWRNLAAAGLADEIRVIEGDAERLDEILAPPSGPRFVVTNPPFGRRVASPAVVDALYRGVASACRRAHVGRIVTITERAAVMVAALTDAGYEIDGRLPVVYGSTRVEVLAATR